jgi:hypothetical protein
MRRRLAAPCTPREHVLVVARLVAVIEGFLFLQLAHRATCCGAATHCLRVGYRGQCRRRRMPRLIVAAYTGPGWWLAQAWRCDAIRGGQPGFRAGPFQLYSYRAPWGARPRRILALHGVRSVGDGGVPFCLPGRPPLLGRALLSTAIFDLSTGTKREKRPARTRDGSRCAIRRASRCSGSGARIGRSNIRVAAGERTTSQALSKLSLIDQMQ